MPTYFCSAQVVHNLEEDVAAVSRSGAAQLFRARNGQWPDTVADDVCVGGCEACGEAIFGDELSICSADGVRLHNRCLPEGCAEREVVNG